MAYPFIEVYVIIPYKYELTIRAHKEKIDFKPSEMKREIEQLLSRLEIFGFSGPYIINETLIDWIIEDVDKIKAPLGQVLFEQFAIRRYDIFVTGQGYRYGVTNQYPVREFDDGIFET